MEQPVSFTWMNSLRSLLRILSFRSAADKNHMKNLEFLGGKVNTKKDCLRSQGSTDPSDQIEIDPQKLAKSVSIFVSGSSCLYVPGYPTIRDIVDRATHDDLLGRLFDKFDALAITHGVQRINTFGDTYVAATNTAADQAEDHAARLARFAVAVMSAARSTRLDENDPKSPFVIIHAGMHCGEAPANALNPGKSGRRVSRPGDTLSVASLMEITSETGRVQCSGESAAAIARQAGDIELEPRAGGLEVMGQGHMQTFWLGAAPQPPAPARVGGSKRGQRFSLCGVDQLDISARRMGMVLSSPGSFDQSMLRPPGSNGAGVARRILAGAYSASAPNLGTLNANAVTCQRQSAVAE
jgi:class 3 adenylate cyclase